MKIIKQGKRYRPPIVVTCSECDAQIEVDQNDWKSGTYGGEKVVSCPCCQACIVKPGTEYTGDF
jgi:NAD-dependent SIR2 family protein deacetylase